MFVSTCLWHMQFFVCKCPGLIVCGSYCRTKYMESRVSALAISQGLFTDWHAKTKTLSGSCTLWHCLNDYKFGGRDQHKQIYSIPLLRLLVKLARLSMLYDIEGSKVDSADQKCVRRISTNGIVMRSLSNTKRRALLVPCLNPATLRHKVSTEVWPSPHTDWLGAFEFPDDRVAKQHTFLLRSQA